MKTLILLLSLSLISCKPIELPKADNSGKGKIDRSVYVWKKFPIVITMEFSKRAEYESSLSNAVDKWNTALGFTAFDYKFDSYDDTHYVLKSSGDNRIYFTYMYNFVDDYLGNYLNVFDDKTQAIYHSDIVICARYAEGSDYILESVLTHQLGHVLGEMHPSPGTDSISAMNRGADENYHVDLSPGDVQRVRARYGIKSPTI